MVDRPLALSRLLVALLALTCVQVVPALALPQLALAQDDDDDDDDWDDEGEGDDEEDDEDDEDKDPQPPVTAGGMFTKKSYPVAELQRTLTVIGGMFEFRAGLDIDASNQQAFETWFGVVEGRYGIQDNFEFQFGSSFLLTGNAAPGVGGTNQATLQAGFENSIYFDLVDFRMGLEVPINPDCGDECDKLAVDLAFGFPFRYRAHPKVAIIALDKLMTIHFADRKPDLTLGVGAVFQPVDLLAIVARAELFVGEFNFDAGRAIPATLAAQFSPNNRIDLGLEFTFRNLDAKDAEGDAAPFDQRKLLVFVQARF